MILRKLKQTHYSINSLYKLQKHQYSTSSGNQNASSQNFQQKAAYSDILNIDKSSQGDKQLPILNDDDEEQKDEIWYDIAIIGGGSGGLSLAFEAKKIGLNPVIFDYVQQSNQSHTWGLGGTCVNVGCIPKKLMHIAGQIGETISDSLGYGWDMKIDDEKLVKQKFSWKEMVYNIRKYILDTNIFYEMQLEKEKIPYLNAFATLHDNHTIVYSNNKQDVLDYLTEINKKSQLTNDQQAIQDKDNSNILKQNIKLKSLKAKSIVLCTGGRPNTYLNTCPDINKYAMTSDDFFFNQQSPGKTLVVGGGYIALECAGILSSLGNPVSLMTKGKYLKDFDQQMANIIVENLSKFNKVNTFPTSLPIDVKQEAKTKKLNVKFQNLQTKEIKTEQFDSILMAIGRVPNTDYLNLDRIGIKYNKENNKIIGGFNGETEQTSVDNIFALGDILDNVMDLTSVAQKQGKFLAKRLFYKNMALRFKMNTQKEQEKFTINYDLIPTTIFTPSEYSCVGLSEEQAISKYGQKNIVVYHSRYIPLDQTLGLKVSEETFEPLKKKSYVKIICNKNEDEKILGMHYIGKQAGEIMQGFSVLMNYAYQQNKLDIMKDKQEIDQNGQNNLNWKQKIIQYLQEKDDNQNIKKKESNSEQRLSFNKQFLDLNVGIHPTLAEEFINLTKKSSENPDQESC